MSWLLYRHTPHVLPQSSVVWLNQVKPAQPGERILVFSPHPDDETIAVGGIINQAVRAGAMLRIVLVTDGNRHGLENRRYLEFRRATGVLGVAEQQLEFWGYPDGGLRFSIGPLRERVSQEFCEFRPSEVIYPHPADRHPDHAWLGRVIEEELAELVDDQKPEPYRYLVHYRHFPQAGLLGRPTKLLPPLALLSFDQQWQRYNLTPDEKAVKYRAVNEYSSQLQNPFLHSLFFNLLRDNELLARWTPPTRRVFERDHRRPV
ncbi:MAG: PIG-L family deacetylase [Syntrophomonadaceae bacterium]|nr:PIG-L family deacetylase [Syntrophomonadaceae bacterium]